MSPIRIGMIGGGEGAFIGAVHRMALALDGDFELVAGCFGTDPANTERTGRALGLDTQRLYRTWQELVQGEGKRPEDERIQALAIVTPNHVHHGPAMAALEAGMHVACEKPLTTSAALADDMARSVKKSGRQFLLTHNYTGYPMIREARERIASGELGTVRKVYVEYLQGWLSGPLEETGQKQAGWRTDPERSGPVGALGDIGTHAFNLAEHLTGQDVRDVLADLNTFVPGRRVDDDAMVLLRLDSGATGTLVCSQVAHGRENGLAIRIFGTEGSLAWEQEHPEDLHLWDRTGSRRVLRPNTPATSEACRSRSRVPSGHPEGYIEGFANLYRSFARAIRGEEDLEDPFPGIRDGVREMRFIEACLASTTTSTWVPLPA